MTPFRPQLLAALVGIVLVIGVLAWSTTAGPQSSTNSPSGTYVEAIVGEPHFLNPLLATSDTDTDLTHLIFSGLSRVDERGELVLDLAESMEASPDSLVYTFTLKPDLRWHDGNSLTADDVFVTLSLLQAPDFPGDPSLAQRWRGVRADPVSQQVVRFTLPAPDASFAQHTTLGILPRQHWAGIKAAEMDRSPLNLAAIGSGPWRLVPPRSESEGSSQANSSAIPLSEGVLLEPNPYSKPETPPGVERVWFRQYPSFGAALEGFKRGEVHGLGHIPSDQVAALRDVPGVTLHTQNLARYSMLMLNVRSPLFRDAETRRAISLAVDREAIIREALDDQGLALESPALLNSWALDRSIKPLGYNLAEARKLLDSAGWRMSEGGVLVRQGITMTAVLAANRDIPQNVRVAQSLERDLRRLGVDVQLALVGRDTLLRDYMRPRAFHMALVGWEAPGADPDLYPFWHSSQRDIIGGMNFSAWANPEADEALLAARATQDREERRKQLQRFQQAFAYHVPAVVLYTPIYTYATRQPATNVRLPETDMLGPAYRFSTLWDWRLSGK
jgi:peptide/nickel transport system substrate-binding protein